MDTSSPVIAAQITLKGILLIKNDDLMAYDDLASLKSVVQAVINRKFFGDVLIVEDCDGVVHHVPVELVELVEGDANSHEVELIVPASDLSNELAKIDVCVDSDEIEDELMDICSDHCDVLSVEREFMCCSNIASLVFTDGSSMKFGHNANAMIVTM